MKYLITGGCGFLGSNLASETLKRGEELSIFDNLSRFGSAGNLEWLRQQGEFHFVHGDIRHDYELEKVIREIQPDVIFHLAGQVAMTTSIANPRLDFDVNAKGALNVLEAVRTHCPDCIVIYSSTNKVYGDLEWVRYEEKTTRYVAPDYPNGFDESISLDLHSPYGCSKGTADQYMLDYARMFGLRTVVFRHSSMYGGRQYATYDQGWIGWFCQKALEIQQARQANCPPPTFTISGGGKQVRDVLHADDIIRLYFAAVAHIGQIHGKVFNIGGGMQNSLSLLELFTLLEELLEIRMVYEKLPWRQSDQKMFVADMSKVSKHIEWHPLVEPREGVKRMIQWLQRMI